MKILKKNIVSLLLLIFLVVFTVIFISIYQQETKKRYLKKDLIELSDAKYGIFNVDEWKKNISIIVGNRINELKFDSNNRVKAKKQISKFLHTAVDEFENNYKKENEKDAIFGVSIRNIGSDFFGFFDQFRRDIPKFADSILDFLDKKENKERIKQYILNKLNEYSDKTFQKMDYSVYYNIISKYRQKNAELTKSFLNTQINKLVKSNNIKNYFVFAMFIVLFIIVATAKNTSKLFYYFSVIIAFEFLLLGILLPMIDIDARISSMSFKLLGENISFANQVLYYKSKSILEMAGIMLSQNEFKIILVGVLVLLFSVLFPIVKLFSTLLLLYNNKFRNNKFINFMIFKSGKWSMSDVMVVAIFMSYIGFTGIISNQLSALNQSSGRLHILTTNYSELQNGFYYFLAFVLLSLIISQKLSSEQQSEK